MKYFNLLLVIVLVFSAQAVLADQIAFQGFEGSDSWNYTENPSIYNTEGDPICTGDDDVWDRIQEFTTPNITPATDTWFWGMQDLENSNGGGAFDHVLTFDDTNVSGYTDVTLTFKYNFYEFDVDYGDYLKYELVYNGSGQGEVLITPTEGSNPSSAGWETITANVPGGTNTVGLKLIAYQNGASDYAGWDDVSLEGTGGSSGPETITNFTIDAATYNQMQITWTKPTGTYGTDWHGVVIFAREGSVNDADISSSDGIDYTPDLAYGSGTQNGNSFCVARSTADADGNIVVTNLIENQEYYFIAYTYQEVAGDNNDDVWSSASTEVNDEAEVQGVTGFGAAAGNEQVDLSWTNNPSTWWDNVLILAKQGSAVDGTPTGDGSAYTANAAFGSGTEVGTGNFVVYKGTGTSETVTNVINGTTYHFRAFVHDGTHWTDADQYQSTSATPASVGAPPAGYYDPAAGLTGTALKAALHEIIDDHTRIGYSSLWEPLEDIEEDPNNSSNVLLLYSGRSVPKLYHSGSGGNDEWNKEHVWAKSHGDFGTSNGAGSDLHHLRPTDVNVNSSRGNEDFDNGGGVAHAEAPECFSDTDSWEPRDEVKGDVARMIFYMAVRYEGGGDEPDLEVVDSVDVWGSADPNRPYHGKLSTLIRWHEDDPVTDRERIRNHAIYTTYQYNRNPFIDHPEYVRLIWDPSYDAYVRKGVPTTGVYSFDNGGEETAVDINFTNIADGGEITVQRFPDGARNVSGLMGNISPYRWLISNSDVGINVNGAQIQIDYTQIPGAGISNPNTVSIARRDIEGVGPFNVLATSVNGTELVATVSEMSELILVSDDNPLPVELASFTAENTADGVLLRWRTESQINNAGFHIYRNKERITLVMVEGEGTTIIPKTYSYLDTGIEIGETYRYQLSDLEEYTMQETFHYCVDITYEQPIAREEIVKPTPSNYALHVNYPNPFNPTTTITFDLPEPVRVNLSIYDITGQLVKTLVNGAMDAGSYPVQWDGTNEVGDSVNSGVYFYRMTTDNFMLNDTKKMILMK